MELIQKYKSRWKENRTSKCSLYCCAVVFYVFLSYSFLFVSSIFVFSNYQTQLAAPPIKNSKKERGLGLKSKPLNAGMVVFNCII